MPAHFAAVTSTEHFTTKMINFCHSHSDACAAHRASSSQVGSGTRVVQLYFCHLHEQITCLHRAHSR